MSHFEGWQGNLDLDKLYLGSDQWTKMQEPLSSTDSTQSTADTGLKFLEKSFETPYGARSARFYKWRQSLIDKAADILVDTDVMRQARVFASYVIYLVCAKYVVLSRYVLKRSACFIPGG